MHLSYNVIKGNRAVAKDAKIISTESVIELDTEVTSEGVSGVTYEEAQAYINNYKKLGQNILEDARKRRDDYIVEAAEKAKEIEKEAYEEGYKQGLANGKEDGKKEAFDKYIPQATKQAEDMIANAEHILSSANENYELYLESKKSEIIELVITIAEQVLKREVSDKDSINSLVEEAINLSKGEENVVIKCNSTYEEELKKQIPVWKTLNNISGEIFILTDENMECGNAVIEKKTGKVVVGIDMGLEKIKEAIL